MLLFAQRIKKEQKKEVVDINALLEWYRLGQEMEELNKLFVEREKDAEATEKNRYSLHTR
jgi:hypothetical protein